MHAFPRPSVDRLSTVAFLSEWVPAFMASFCVMKWDRKPGAQKPAYCKMHVSHTTTGISRRNKCQDAMMVRDLPKYPRC